MVMIKLMLLRFFNYLSPVARLFVQRVMAYSKIEKIIVPKLFLRSIYQVKLYITCNSFWIVQRHSQKQQLIMVMVWLKPLLFCNDSHRSKLAKYVYCLSIRLVWLYVSHTRYLRRDHFYHRAPVFDTGYKPTVIDSTSKFYQCGLLIFSDLPGLPSADSHSNWFWTFLSFKPRTLIWISHSWFDSSIVRGRSIQNRYIFQ
jgi:hypothetical protein